MSALLVPAAVVEAQVEDSPTLSIQGFGTFGVVHSDEDQADFVSNLFAPKGAGHSDDWSAHVDSRLGLQLTANLSPRLTSVVQAVSEQRYDGSYEPSIEWANVMFEVTPALSVRLGRMMQPSFMTSEYRKVGYAIPWIRPPEEVYRMVPVTNFDGIDVNYRSRFGDYTHTLRGSYGRKDAKVAGGGEVKSRDTMLLTNTLERGAATLFASYGRYRLTIEDLNPLFDAFQQFGPEGEAIADRYDVDDKRFEIINVGVRYDPGEWFVMGEWARSDSRTFIGDSRGWYVTGGYRLGDVTPYVTLARVRVDGETSHPGISMVGLPPPLAAQADGLNAALNGLLGNVAQQKSLSLGARWDFARNLALKAQYDHIDLDSGSPGTLVNTQPGFDPGGTVNLFSLALDFVY
ncbi:porin [Halomonas lysinitropha]|uniref:porin n=1 Tax=Halomonas lysinitropha TaxID=2607506 RepID=UPI00124A48E5|nr:porin [Halomonas lysinitropha]